MKKKNPVKKWLKILLICFAALFSLILIAFIAFSIAVWDTSDNTVESVRKADLSVEQFADREIVKTLEDGRESDDVSLLLDEYAVNELLYGIASAVELPFVKTAGAYAAYKENGALHIEIPVKVAGIVPTCVKATAKISYENECFKIVVEDAFVGNLSCTGGLIRTFFLNDANGKNWKKDLEKAGIRCDLDLKTLSFSMTADQIAESISNLTETDPNKMLYLLISDLVLKSPELLEFSFGENGFYGVTLHASRLAYDAATDGETSYPLDLNAAIDQTKALYDKGVDRKNVFAVVHYVVSGYDSLDKKLEKPLVDALGLKSNGAGVRTVNGLTMAQVLMDQSGGLEASILNHAATVTVTEKQLNTILAGLDVIGAGTAFRYQDKLAYITLEDMDVRLYDKELKLCVVLNLNGKRLCGYIDAACPDTERITLNTGISTLRLGKEAMNEHRISLFLKYIDDVLKTENWIYADADKRVLTLDMQAALEEVSAYASLLRAYSNVNMQCRRPYDKGQLQLVFRMI